MIDPGNQVDRMVSSGQEVTRMVEELQRLFEEVARQPEEVQLRLAEILRMELEEEEDDEIDVSPELAARLDASLEEIARGEYVTLEELDRHRQNQGR